MLKVQGQGIHVDIFHIPEVDLPLWFGDVLDEIIKSFKDEENNNEDDDSIKFCLIGRPNVGKSSLTNAILNENRVIVSDIEGTTRDAIDTKFIRNEQNYVAIDTAGLKKRGRIFEAIDKYAALRSLSAIDRSDVVFLKIGRASCRERV